MAQAAPSSYRARKRKKRKRIPPEYRQPSTAGMQGTSGAQGWGAAGGAILGGAAAAALMAGTAGMAAPAAPYMVLGGAGLGAGMGTQFGAGMQADQEAQFYADAAEQDRQFSEWALLQQMDAEEEARQAAIDYSFREMVERNIKRTSPEHTFKASNWRNA